MASSTVPWPKLEEGWKTSTYLSNDGGVVWRSRNIGTFEAPELPFAAGSCVGASHCFVDYWLSEGSELSGAMDVTADGTVWRSVPIAQTDASNLSLACTLTDTCYRIDEATSRTTFTTQLLRSSDGGTTWTAVSLPPGIEPVKVAGCQTATTCELFGVKGATLVDGLEGTIDTSAATTVLLTTTDGGATWSTDSVAITGGSFPELASCTSTTACVAVVQDLTPLTEFDEIVATTTGTTWSTASLPTYTQFEETSVLATAFLGGALDCTTSGFCMLGSLPGTSGSLLDVSSNGGMTWQTVAAPVQYSALESVQCFGTDSCDVEYWAEAPTDVVAFAQTDDGGSSWVRTTTVEDNVLTDAGADLSCTSLDECTSVVGGLGTSTTSRRWSARRRTGHDLGAGGLDVHERSIDAKEPRRHGRRGIPELLHHDVPRRDGARLSGDEPGSMQLARMAR